MTLDAVAAHVASVTWWSPVAPSCRPRCCGQGPLPQDEPSLAVKVRVAHVPSRRSTKANLNVHLKIFEEVLGPSGEASMLQIKHNQHQQSGRLVAAAAA